MVEKTDIQQEGKKMKKIGVKGIIGIIVGAVAALAIIAVVAIMFLRVNEAEARQIALQQAGGGEIVEQEISSEGLWNEYSYTVVNGDSWCEVEISGFGNVEGMETGTGNSYRY